MPKTKTPKTVTNAQLVSMMLALKAENPRGYRKMLGLMCAMAAKNNPDLAAKVRKIDRRRLELFDRIEGKLTRAKARAVWAVAS